MRYHGLNNPWMCYSLHYVSIIRTNICIHLFTYVYKSLWFFIYTYVYTYSNDNTHIISLSCGFVLMLFAIPPWLVCLRFHYICSISAGLENTFHWQLDQTVIHLENTKKIPAKRIFFQIFLVRCNNGWWCFICFWRCNRRRWDLMFLGKPSDFDFTNDAVLNQSTELCWCNTLMAG